MFTNRAGGARRTPGGAQSLLSLYNTPPDSDVSLDEFELFAVDRYNLLKVRSPQRARDRNHTSSSSSSTRSPRPVAAAAAAAVH